MRHSSKIVILLAVFTLFTISGAIAGSYKDSMPESAGRVANDSPSAPVMVPATKAPAPNYNLDWYVVSSGGAGTDYLGTPVFKMGVTVGQTTIGKSTSANSIIDHGFWSIFSDNVTNCCLAWGIPGDPNKDGNVNLTDILDAISYVYVVPLGEPIAADGCDALYDVNGDGLTVDIPVINLTDILDMITHVYVEPLGDPILCCPPGCLYP